MEKIKDIDKHKIISLYMEDVLTGNKCLTSVYSFSKYHNFDESVFYKFFSSLGSIDDSVFNEFFNKTEAMLLNSDDYTNYEAKNKLLSFYYTFFELLTANRSFVVLKLEKEKNKLEVLKKLGKLKKSFKNYVKNLDIDTLDFKNNKINKAQKMSLSNISWMQFIVVLKFWLEDKSVNFEKTDLFIEKSILAGFDIIDVTPVKSVIDLAKFIWKEKKSSI